MSHTPPAAGTDDAAVVFRADTLAAANQEPHLALHGMAFHGRLLSIVDWLPFWERYVATQKAIEVAIADKRLPDLRPSTQLWIDFLRAIFPKDGRRWFAPDPVKLLAKEPGTVLRDTFNHFFFHQARSVGLDLGHVDARPTPTPGPNSNGATPADAPAPTTS